MLFHVRGVENVDRNALVLAIRRIDPVIRELKARKIALTSGEKIAGYMLAALYDDYEQET